MENNEKKVSKKVSPISTVDYEKATRPSLSKKTKCLSEKKISQQNSTDIFVFLSLERAKIRKNDKDGCPSSDQLAFTTKKNRQENIFLMEANSAWKQTRALRPGKRRKDRTNMAGIE